MAYIAGLDTSSPAGTDSVAVLDTEIQTFKTDVQDSFPNVDGAVTVTDTELNLLAGRSAIGTAAEKDHGNSIGNIPLETSLCCLRSEALPVFLR